MTSKESYSKGTKKGGGATVGRSPPWCPLGVLLCQGLAPHTVAYAQH